MEKPHEEHITITLLQENATTYRLTLPGSATLKDVLITGAQHAGVQLLPNAEESWDRLHNMRHHDAGPAIQDLGQNLSDYLKLHETTRDFGIELLRIFRVNTRSAIAPEASLSPRQILGLVRLDFQEYTLYRQNSTDVLPLETPLQITRGDVFEAQRDGKYGGAN